MTDALFHWPEKGYFTLEQCIYSPLAHENEINSASYTSFPEWFKYWCSKLLVDMQLASSAFKSLKVTEVISAKEWYILLYKKIYSDNLE